MSTFFSRAKNWQIKSNHFFRFFLKMEHVPLHFHPLPTKPGAHLHPKPPGLLKHWPPSGAHVWSPSSHSFISVHVKPSPTNPFLHSQVTEPTVLAHVAYWEHGLCSGDVHSSISKNYFQKKISLENKNWVNLGR